MLIVASYLSVRPWEWLGLLLAIGLVWTAEAFNTALEVLADRVCKEDDLLIKRAKDVAGAAVLLSSCTAVAVAVVVFLPYLAR